MKHVVLALGLVIASASQLSNAADPPPAKDSPATSSPATSSPATSSPAAPPAATGGSPSSAKPATPPADDDAARAAKVPMGPVYVQVTTSLGNFTIELLSERSPVTVVQFLKNVDQGFYSGTIFHRIIPNFVIQGGGYDSSYQLKPVATRVFNESGNGLTNLRGTVGMARTTAPHSGDVQFYVNLFDNGALDPNPNRWGYAVFGKVVQGMEVVDKIGNVATGAKGPFKEDAPLKPVVIQKIQRIAAP